MNFRFMWSAKDQILILCILRRNFVIPIGYLKKSHFQQVLNENIFPYRPFFLSSSNKIPVSCREFRLPTVTVWIKGTIFDRKEPVSGWKLNQAGRMEKKHCYTQEVHFLKYSKHFPAIYIFHLSIFPLFPFTYKSIFLMVAKGPTFTIPSTLLKSISFTMKLTNVCNIQNFNSFGTI